MGDFTNYFMEGTTVTKQQFQASVNSGSLLLTYIFIARFFLSYISMVIGLSTYCYFSKHLTLVVLRTNQRVEDLGRS